MGAFCMVGICDFTDSRGLDEGKRAGYVCEYRQCTNSVSI